MKSHVLFSQKNIKKTKHVQSTGMPPPFGPLALPQGMTQEQLQHKYEGLGLPSIKDTYVMTSKRNTDINVNVNLNANLQHLLDSGYESDMCMSGHTDIT